MSVLAFERKQGADAWSEVELNTLFAALNAALASENGRGWETGVTERGDPQFYQSYFEPAVMVGCGRGFVVSETQSPKPVADFLERRRDSFDCREIPADLPHSDDMPRQKYCI